MNYPSSVEVSSANGDWQSHVITESPGRAIMCEWVLPSHTNALGTIFGGVLLSWIDIAGVFACQRYARAPVVTLSMDQIHFLAPVKIGYTVLVQAEVIHAGKTSMEVEVVVDAENTVTGEKIRAAKGFLCYVALDGHGKPRGVPPFIPKTERELIRAREAEEIRAYRRRWR